jgi:hypothetical protein
MHRILKYRSVGVALALIFCLFNVGLPIIVASCPMMRTSTAPCCAPVHSGSSRIASPVDRSCCRTIIAGERNTTEFLQVAAASHAINGGTLYVPLTADNRLLDVEIRIGALLPSEHSPHLLADNLPVVFSSLLI